MGKGREKFWSAEGGEAIVTLCGNHLSSIRPLEAYWATTIANASAECCFGHPMFPRCWSQTEGLQQGKLNRDRPHSTFRRWCGTGNTAASFGFRSASRHRRDKPLDKRAPRRSVNSVPQRLARSFEMA